jgi:uncharacterized protein YutE (UPF0331/DUF86 family)
MTPLKPEQEQSVATRLSFIETELNDLISFEAMDWPAYSKDRDKRRNLERLIENLANACIDIGKIILSGEEVEMPDNYRDVIIKLGELKIIPDKVAQNLSDLVITRNILAHQYLDLKWDKIKLFLQTGHETVSSFARKAQELLHS